jgi:hypothetical protein
MTQLAIINNITKICENVSTDIRQANEINIEGYTVLDLEQTPVINWNWNESLNDYEEVENIGNGGIGFVYIEGKLVAVKPTEIPQTQQPTSTGTEEI